MKTSLPSNLRKNATIPIGPLVLFLKSGGFTTLFSSFKSIMGVTLRQMPMTNVQ
ncbi:hypothetical protein [Marininema halotolerans]|uniref:Uncharacterized protein n=1 Tax=Marininema halotolerans TaxID=1155944 RepID=A0A1I6SMG9_9BACL|nr:hypothetical protein [Marininema halotolerans]SFS78133.1 hypothetical protein SAMN05444972_107201 [Marininema halotolerans]